MHGVKVFFQSHQIQVLLVVNGELPKNPFLGPIDHFFDVISRVVFLDYPQMALLEHLVVLDFRLDFFS